MPTRHVTDDFDAESTPDPDTVPIRERRLITQPYDFVVSSLMTQIAEKTIFLRPVSSRPSFQRNYVWSDVLASRLMESILLNVPIPPCYLSQNQEYELDVIDGQQRLYSVYRFCENQFALKGLEIFTELNGSRYHEISAKLKRKIETHTLRCILVTNESHPEIKFDVFQRLNTNTVPLNAQELRHCVARGALISLLGDAVSYEPWLSILGRRQPDRRMRDEELALRFYAFLRSGVESYRTPQKHWLTDTARDGRRIPAAEEENLKNAWRRAVDTSLLWFEPHECFRRPDRAKGPINRSLFDLVMVSAEKTTPQTARQVREPLRERYNSLLLNEEFADLIGRAVDHKKRTLRRFQLWNEAMRGIL